jgi:hypothetical protein
VAADFAIVNGGVVGAETPGNNTDLWNRTPIPSCTVIDPMISIMEQCWTKTLRDNLCLYKTPKIEGQISTTGMVFTNTCHSLNLQRSVRPSARFGEEFPIESCEDEDS